MLVETNLKAVLARDRQMKENSSDAESAWQRVRGHVIVRETWPTGMETTIWLADANPGQTKDRGRPQLSHLNLTLCMHSHVSQLERFATDYLNSVALLTRSRPFCLRVLATTRKPLLHSGARLAAD
eukprot:4497459-Pleurochrysis_carterae.AAC.1